MFIFPCLRPFFPGHCGFTFCCSRLRAIALPVPGKRNVGLALSPYLLFALETATSKQCKTNSL